MSAAACAPAWKAAWAIAPIGRGGRSGLPCSPTRPPAASTVNSVAGSSAAGPVVPNGVTETWMTWGKRSAIPSVRPDSRNTSASPRKSVGSSATTLRLPTPRAAQYRDSSPAKGGSERLSHPPAGSTLITSAPSSPRMRPASSPQRVVASMTRMCPSGPAMVRLLVRPARPNRAVKGDRLGGETRQPRSRGL